MRLCEYAQNASDIFPHDLIIKEDFKWKLLVHGLVVKHDNGEPGTVLSCISDKLTNSASILELLRILGSALQSIRCDDRQRLHTIPDNYYVRQSTHFHISMLFYFKVMCGQNNRLSEVGVATLIKSLPLSVPKVCSCCRGG